MAVARVRFTIDETVRQETVIIGEGPEGAGDAARSIREKYPEATDVATIYVLPGGKNK